MQLEERNLWMAPGNPLLVLEHFRKHDVPLVVIGGYAVAFHGYRSRRLLSIPLDTDLRR